MRIFWRIVAGTLVCAVLAIAVWVARYDNRVKDAAALTFGDAALCWFDGIYSQSDVPIAVVAPQGTSVVHPWQDFKNTVLNSDGAKPFHFGVVVTPGGGLPVEVWGWSYWHTAFWQDSEGRSFELANGWPYEDACLR